MKLGVAGHAVQRVSRPGIARAVPPSATPVQRAPNRRELDALALRAALSYRAGGSKLCVLALRFDMPEAAVSKALNGWCTAPRRILERLSPLERETYHRVRDEAEQAATRAA